MTLFFLAMLTAASVANAEAPPSLTLKELSAEGSKLTGTVSVMGDNSTPSFRSIQKNQDLRTSATRLPLDLWILFDNSALCEKHSADRRLSAYLKKLNDEMPSRTRASLLLYRRGALEVLAMQEPIAALQMEKVHCQSDTVSADPEKALQHVLGTSLATGLKREIWILSSGNVGISSATLAKLKEEKSALHLFVYNPAVFGALTSLLDSQRSKMGAEFYSSRLLADESMELPSRTFQLTALVPGDISQKTAFSASLVQDGKAIQSAPISISLAPDRKAGWLNLLWEAACYGLGLGLGVYLGFKVYRYYCAKYCGQCAVRMRHEDKVCPFCFEKGGAYLVAQSPTGQEPSLSSLVAPLHDAITSIGTHRKSALRCIRHKGERRQIFFKVQRDVNSFLLLPGAHAVFVNGVAVLKGRYLASGDSVQVLGTQFRFIQNERAN